MNTIAKSSPHVLSLAPGRARFHLPDWSGENPEEIERRLAQVHGVRRVQANAITGNVLVHFDPVVLSTESLVFFLSALPEGLVIFPSSEGSLYPDPATAVPTEESLGSPVVKAVFRGVVGHAVVDICFYSTTASAYALGWTWVGALGLLHLMLDVVVWGAALQPIVQYLRQKQAKGIVIASGQAA